MAKDKEYTGIQVVDEYLNGGATPFRADVKIDTKSLVLPIAVAAVGVALVVLIFRKTK